MTRRVVWDSTRQREWDAAHGIVEAAPADNAAPYAAAGAMLAALGRNELPERAPSYRVGRDRNTYVTATRPAPMLPAMPTMLPEEPTEAAITGAALRAMMPAGNNDDGRTQAIGYAIRAVTFGAVAEIAATLAWGAAWQFLGVGWEWLPVVWLAAALAVIGYLLASEAAGRKYSAAGVELRKVDAAVQIHADRLESRERMHAQATEAWERVMIAGLDRWQGGGE